MATKSKQQKYRAKQRRIARWARALKSWADKHPSHREAAKVIPVPEETLSRWINGKGAPSHAVIVARLTDLGVRP